MESTGLSPSTRLGKNAPCHSAVRLACRSSKQPTARKQQPMLQDLGRIGEFEKQQLYTCPKKGQTAHSNIETTLKASLRTMVLVIQLGPTCVVEDCRKSSHCAMVHWSQACTYTMAFLDCHFGKMRLGNSGEVSNLKLFECV